MFKLPVVPLLASNALHNTVVDPAEVSKSFLMAAADASALEYRISLNSSCGYY